MPSIFFSEKRSVSDLLFFAEFRERYLNTVCKQARQRPVYLMRPIPDMPIHVPKAVGRAMIRGLAGNVSVSREH